MTKNSKVIKWLKHFPVSSAWAIICIMISLFMLNGTMLVFMIFCPGIIIGEIMVSTLLHDHQYNKQRKEILKKRYNIDL